MIRRLNVKNYNNWVKIVTRTAKYKWVDDYLGYVYDDDELQQDVGMYIYGDASDQIVEEIEIYFGDHEEIRQDYYFVHEDILKEIDRRNRYKTNNPRQALIMFEKMLSELRKKFTTHFGNDALDRLCF